MFLNYFVVIVHLATEDGAEYHLNVLDKAVMMKIVAVYADFVGGLAIVAPGGQCDATKKGPQNCDPSVIRRGFEPLTVCLEGRCSIQLSYRTRLLLKRGQSYCF